MCVEDDHGHHHLFDPQSHMVAEITWRAWIRDSSDRPGDLEGTAVVQMHGESGMWEMGSTLDFTGRTRWGDTVPPLYEVAVISATVVADSGDSPSAFSITSEDWLQKTCDGNLLIMPAMKCPEMPPIADPQEATPPCATSPDTCAQTGDPVSFFPRYNPYDPQTEYEGVRRRRNAEDGDRVFIFTPPLPRYKMIRPVAINQTRFRIRPVYTHKAEKPLTIFELKLVLRIRRCRTKLVPV
jgi:hypothetical protein